MLICMRTTLSLDDNLLKRAKELSARTNQTLTSIIETALRSLLNGRPEHVLENNLKLHTFKGRGLQPGVDLDDSSALLDLMEGDDSL